MPTRTLLSALAITATTALVAGCGAETPPSPPGSPDNPLAARTPDASQPQTREANGTRAAVKPGYETLVQRQSSRQQTRFTPCSLVTRAQARAIIGAPVQLPFEAPQGPTCVYRAAKGHGLVTVAVQETDFAKAKGNLEQATKVPIASRTGICGQYGQPTLYVPLSRGRVLTVAARCPVAKQFATRAVRHLGA